MQFASKQALMLVTFLLEGAAMVPRARILWLMTVDWVKSGTCMRKDPIRSTILLFLSMPGVERVPGSSGSENHTVEG